jgi:plasmid stabilization system protein ParE
MPAPVPFTRDDIAAYEKSTPAPAPSTQEANATPADETPAPTAESSTAESSSDPAVPETDETSADTADSATAPAASDGEAQTGDEGDEGGEQPAPAPKGSARSRIEELVDERNALRKYGEYLLEQNKALLAQSSPAAATATTAAAPAAPVSADDEPPTLEAYDFDPVKHAKAQNDWLKKQVQRQVKATLETVTTQQTAAQAIAKFEERAAEFAKANPDFQTVVSNPALPQFRPEIAQLIVKSEHGPAVNYYLARNPDVATRISRLSITEQAAQIGRIESQVSATGKTAPSTKQATPAAPKQKSGTKAPPPPTPTPSGSAASKSPGEMSMDEWVANERAKKIAQREQRQKLRSAMR